MVMTSRKRSFSDMRNAKTPPKQLHFDEVAYRAAVLQLPQNITEDDADEKLAQEAHDLGLMPALSDVDGMTCSFSTTTVASDPTNKSSILSQSTAPTSCSSSERRAVDKSSFPLQKSPAQSNNPSIVSDLDKKRDSGFRKGFRKMTGFRKRRSGVITSSTMTSINSELASTTNADRTSIMSDVKSPASIKSSKSSWSSPPSATKSSYEQSIPMDNEAIKRTMDCKEMLALHSRQLEEKMRFLEYQRAILTTLRVQHQSAKSRRIESHQRIVAGATEKNDRAVEDLESRQLEEELRMMKEFEVEKRSVMVRLRHMEAYCQNPTPPPTPIDPTSGRPSLDAPLLPERKVTERDYHSLAQQYRERDAMDGLHSSKINVLRGKQKKAVENFVGKKEREMEAVERLQRMEVAEIEAEAAGEEEGLRLVFGAKRTRLEMRWRLQAGVERGKMERVSGLAYAALPDVVAIEDLKGSVAAASE